MKNFAPDLRVEKTLKKLEKGLFELLSELPISKITVKSLCQRACINRSTFYAYFTSPEDLLDFFEDQYIKEMFSRIRSSFTSPENIKTFYTLMLRHIYEHRSLFHFLYVHDYQHFTDKTISYTISSSEVSSGMYDRQPDAHSISLKLFNLYGGHALIRLWLINGCSIPPEKLAADLHEYTKRLTG